jgi:2-dehydropantoate 2-reductase
MKKGAEITTTARVRNFDFRFRFSTFGFRNHPVTTHSLGKIAVIGSGAIGGYYGGMLAHVGCDVHFLLRSDLDAVRKRGLTIHTRGETIHLPHVSGAASPEEIGPCDLVIIALKATANAALEKIVPPLLN